MKTKIFIIILTIIALVEGFIAYRIADTTGYIQAHTEQRKGVFEMTETDETSESAPASEPLGYPALTYGNEGRLFIGYLSVALYHGLEQEICDAVDSACYDVYKDVVIIADHSHQGFDTIKKCSVGDECVILREDGTHTVYVCTRVESNGRNMKNDLVDEAGISVFDAGVNMIAYTCNESWENVFIVYFSAIADAH